MTALQQHAPAMALLPPAQIEPSAGSFVVLDEVLAPRACRELVAEADRDRWVTSTAELDGAHDPRRILRPILAPRRVSEPTQPRHLIGTQQRPRFALIEAPLLALRLFYRLVAELPLSREGAELAGLKPLLRCTEFRAGEGTRAHCDPARETPEGQRSQLSVVVFLNEGFRGGAVSFPDLGRRVEARAGRAIVFPHGLSHVDERVESGRKFVLETEVFYDSAWSPYRA